MMTKSSNGKPNQKATFVYIDETVFKDKFIGVCALETNHQIGQDVVASALENLKIDPDIIGNKLDQETIRRGYFHASEDSKNAHSHFARSIKSTIAGTVHFSYIPFLNDATKEKDFRSNTIFSFMLKLKLPQEVKIYFEKRHGFSGEVFKKEIETLYGHLDRMAYNLPFTPTFYPKLELIPSDKREPGIQVADYILWALNWTIYEPASKNARWLAWAGAESSAVAEVPIAPGFSDRGGKFGWYTLSQALPDDIIKQIETYPLTARMQTLSTEETLGCYIRAEQLVHSLKNYSFPAHAKHFEQNALNLIRDLRNPTVGTRRKVVSVASMFLRLFDTLPLYAGIDKTDDRFAELMRMRKYMGLLFHENLLHGARMMDACCQMRDELLRTDPSKLGLS